MTLNYVLGTIVIILILGVLGYGLKCLIDLRKEWKEDEK